MARKWGRGSKPKPTKQELMKQREFLILMGADGSDEVHNYTLKVITAKSFTLYGPWLPILQKDTEKWVPKPVHHRVVDERNLWRNPPK